MTVSELIEHLKTFPPEMEVRSGIVIFGKVRCSWTLEPDEVRVMHEDARGDVVIILSE